MGDIHYPTQRPFLFVPFQLGHLNHHNILRLVTAYEDPDEELVIQITEFLSGGELFERILDSAEKLMESEIRDYIRQAHSIHY